MSEEYTAESTIFVKVDGDQAREVLTANGVSAFPTFKVFKGNAEVLIKGGFAKDDIAKAMVSAGAALAGAGTKTD